MDGISFIALNIAFAVSLSADTASFITGGLPTFTDPNTVMNIIGNNKEKTTEVGLLNVASRLYFEIIKAACS